MPSTGTGIIERIEDYNHKVRHNQILCILQPCPRCGVTADHFGRHELRKRQFNVFIEQIIHTIMGLLIRWACPGCRKTFSQYPEFAIPYKRYVLPGIMQYAERYVEMEKITYAQLVEKWAAGYNRHSGDESQLWPSTIHRWITSLGGLPNVIARAQQLVHQKNPTAGITRHLSQLSVSSRKFMTNARRLILIGCRQLLSLERFFHEIFHVSIFPKLGADCVYT